MSMVISVHISLLTLSDMTASVIRLINRSQFSSANGFAILLQSSMAIFQRRFWLVKAYAASRSIWLFFHVVHTAELLIVLSATVIVDSRKRPTPAEATASRAWFKHIYLPRISK